MFRTLVYMVCLGLFFHVQISACEYTLDPNHASVTFKARHMMVANVNGEFKDFSTELCWQPDNIEKSYINGTIQVASINTDHKTRDGHLRSPQFFDSDTYPSIEFKSGLIKKGSIGPDGAVIDTENIFEHVLCGELTIKDVTHPNFCMTLLSFGPIVNQGIERVGFEAMGMINRFDFNISWNKLMDQGFPVVSEDIFFVITAESYKMLEPDDSVGQKNTESPPSS